MKRWIALIVSLMLITSSVLPEDMAWARTIFTDELDETIVLRSSFNDTFPTIDGGTVLLREDPTKKVTVLIFGQTVCSNTPGLLQSISKSGWIHDSNIKVIFAEANRANEAVTRHFMKRYGCEEMTACYSMIGGISEAMWAYLGSSDTGALPVVVLLDKRGKVQEVLSACYSAGDLYQAMRKFAEIEGNESDAKGDPERMLSVNGKEDYDEAKKVFRLLNQARAMEGVSALRLDRELTETAMIRAAELSLYYNHIRPCGKDCFSLFRQSSACGENIAVGSKTASDVMDSWIKSKNHYANIVKNDYTSVGIGCFTDSNGMRYWVQCFDNGTAKELEKYGIQQVQRSVPILESHIHLEAIHQVFTISCADNAEQVKIDIRNMNEMFQDSIPRIQPSDLVYSSDNLQIAEADENGTIIVKAAGSTTITAALKAAPDINVKIYITKKEHSYIRVSEKEGTVKYVCENCSGIQGVSPEIGSNISVARGKSTIKIIDATTKMPVSLARIWANGENWTDKNGMVYLNQTGTTNILVEKDGYYKKTVKKNLNPYQCQVIMLCPDTGELKIFFATLNVAGKDVDVLDQTFSIFDKDLDGETNVVDADFTLRLESAGKPVKYELMQNGKVIQTSTDGVFTLPGHYSNNKKGVVSYYLDGFAAGYEVTVRVTDQQGKSQKQKLGIKVSKASSSVFKTIKKLEESDKESKVSFGDNLSITIPDSFPIMGGTELSFGFDEKLPIQVSLDAETGLVRVALNMGKFDTGDSEKWIKKKQEYKRLKEKARTGMSYGMAFGGTPKSFGAGMFAVSGDIMGYGEGYLLDNSDSLRVNLGAVVSIKAESGFTQYYYLPGIITPVFVSFEGGISCNVSGETNLAFGENGMMINGGSLEFEPSIYVKPEAGIGVDGMLSFSAYGKIDVTWLYRYLNQYSRVTLSGTARLKKNICSWSDEYELWSNSWVIYESNRNKSPVSRGKLTSDFNRNKRDLFGMELISMDYLSQREHMADSVGIFADMDKKTDQEDSTVILDYAYENASPRLIRAGEKLYLFYLDGVTGRSECDQTALFYRISSDQGTTWSKAMRADGGANETADYNFDITVNGMKIYAVWSDAGKIYGDAFLNMDSAEAIAKVTKEMDLMVSVIDVNTGAVQKTSVIKTPHAELQPKIASGSRGEVYTAWISNDLSAKEGLFSNKNNMCICYASSKEDFAMHSVPLSKGIYPLTLDVGKLGDKLYIAASLDTDADLNTQKDIEVYRMCLDGTGTFLADTSNQMVDSAPVFGKIAGNNCLFWHQNGTIAYTSDGKNVHYVGTGDNPLPIGEQFSLLEGNDGDASIVWASTSLTETAGVDIYCSDFDGKGWSGSYRMGSIRSEYTGMLSGYRHSGDYRMVYLGSYYENNTLHSHISIYHPKERIDTSVLWEAETDGVAGQSYPLRLTIVNNGNQTVDRISVRSEDGSIKETLTGISIVPGASKDVIWNGITLPSELTDIFTVDLSILAEGEKESSENRIYLSVGEPDLSIEAYQNFSGGEQFASILVTNNGIIPSDAELTVYKDAEHKKKLYETKVPRLKQDESRITLLNLTELASKSQMFYFVVSDAGNKETYTEDNQAILYVGKGIYLDEEQDSDTDAGNTKPSVNQENKYDNPGNSVEEPLAPIEKKPSVSVVKSLKGKAGKKKLTLSWKKLSGVSGYQIQISTKKNFKGAKKISVSKSKKTYTKKKLKSNKKYYARIRAYKIYKNAKGKKVKAYGKWKTIKKKIK